MIDQVLFMMRSFRIENVFHTSCLDLCRWVPDDTVDLIIIDPPYLLTDETWDDEEVVTDELVQELFRIAKSSCSLYCWCGIGEKSQSLIRWFPLFSKIWKFKDLITWKKQRGIGMRKGWLYTREEIMWFVKDNKRFIWNKEFQYSNEKRAFTLSNNLSEFRRLSNVWTNIKEINQSIAKNTEAAIHPAQKPLKAIERIILAHTKENDIVFDCFVGSGTTAIVAKKLKRQFICGDISERYVNFTIAKLKEF